MTNPLFRIADLHAGYGATPILFGVSLEVHAGEAVALLGKNGMGKTTLMKTAMGFLRPTRGSIAFEGAELTRLTPHEIARLGVGLVPENRRVFPGLADTWTTAERSCERHFGQARISSSQSSIFTVILPSCHV